MSKLHRFAAAAILLIAAAIGCAPRSAGSNAPELAPATVRVVNYNRQDANVYAVRGGTKHRLGTVTTMGSQVYKIPEYLYRNTGRVSFRVELIGSNESFMSLPIPCERGGRIEWRRIRDVLVQTSAMVY